MPALAGDIRFEARRLWTSPRFTFVAILALALGIGAATAIFSVVDTVLLKPLPFRDPDRLAVIWEKNPAQNKFFLFVAGTNYRAWKSRSRVFEDMAAMQPVQINLTGGPNGHIEPEELRAERVTAGLLPLLGAQPRLGRAFLDDEDRPGRTSVALLSHSLWQRRFGADPLIAGKAIRLGNQSYTVVGVMPPGFFIRTRGTDLWTPLGLNPADARVGAARTLTVMARMKPGATMEQAHREMEAIGSDLERDNPALNTGWRPNPMTLRGDLVGATEQPLLVLSAAVSFLLLMACANVAGLLLARGAKRRREVAIRNALGASRGRIIAQLLMESVMVALAGGVAGLMLAWGGVGLAKWLGPRGIPRLEEAQPDARLFLFAFCSSLLTGVLCGIVPALRVSRAHVSSALVESGRGGTAGRSSRRLGDSLVVLEVALAVVVLIGSGLLIRSFARLRAVDPGFRPAGLLTFRTPLGRSAPVERRIAFFDQLAQRLGALPGVRGVGMVNSLPLTGLGVGATFTVEGRPAPPPEQRPIALMRSVSGAYFETMGIRRLAGRDFSPADTAASRPVVIVNQALARRFWPQGSPLGSRLTIDLANKVTPEIVGVVGDVKPERMEGEEWPTIYHPYPQAPAIAMEVVVRTGGPALAAASAVEREVHGIDPDQPVARLRTMQELVDEALGPARFQTVLLAVFAVIAFALAAVGILGVMAQDVSGRTREIGIRMALGAQPRDVLQLMMGRGARLAACGIAAGLAMAFALTRLMTTMLFGVKATDAYTFAAISLLFGSAALVASYLPSRRATALNPVTALRHE